MNAGLAIEGYASLFGVPDLAGDVVRAGAFRASAFRTSLRSQGLPMLVRHDPKLVAGAWRTLQEDARGLFVYGEINPTRPAAALAQRLIARGVDGLSIGFTAKAVKALPNAGRELIEIELWEVSIVDVPMAPQARLTVAQVRRALGPVL